MPLREVMSKLARVRLFPVEHLDENSMPGVGGGENDHRLQANLRCHSWPPERDCRGDVLGPMLRNT